MTIKVLQARAQTSQWQKRVDISFDDQSGLITKIEDAKKSPSEVDFFYDDDCLLFAGMGDIHIHAREDVSGKNTYKEDFHSTCCAAINGGVTHVADMPNNSIAPVDDQTYLDKLKLTEKHPLPILLYAGIGPQTRPLSFIVPYKVYMGPSIGELYFKTNEQLDDVLKHYRDQWVSFHCEDPEILESHKGEDTHEKRRPVIAEVMATDIALMMIEKYNLKGKLCHYSAGEGLAKIRAARKKGVHVTTEVTPQHLYYSVDKIKQIIPTDEQIFFQMNPPIRDTADAESLLEAIRNGEIDYLATDHAPHSSAEKQKGMSGLPGLDTFGPFVTWLLIEKKIDPKIIASICSEKPGAFLSTFLAPLQKHSASLNRWGKGIGQLDINFSASFSILNLNKPITITRENLKTKAAWSPFLGVNFPGSVQAIFVAGKKL
jgi:dihydroorotase